MYLDGANNKQYSEIVLSHTIENQLYVYFINFFNFLNCFLSV